MIESEFVKLTKAAELLKSDADTLLIASTEGRVQLYWLLNQRVYGEKGYYEETTDKESGAPDHYWSIMDRRFRHFMYVPLDRVDAADLLKRDATTARSEILSLKEDGCWWVLQSNWTDEGSRVTEEDFSVTRNAVFMRRDDMDSILQNGAIPADGSFPDTPPPPGRQHESDGLKFMIQASRRFWSGTDKNNRKEHPTNQIVIDWLLEKRGFDEKPVFTLALAKKAASIIRPHWARVGRKPDE
jgi:hypothetical protein